ncbi:MAG: YbaB/EbfC family DNA-binding protein [Actinomycetota bacterium]|nr:YbaB/EbfC family DNA-binding protein [Actinomycetota bacterium]
MTLPVTGTAYAHRGAIRIEVHPGGALADLELTEAALRLGGTDLATTLLDAIDEATAVANQRTRHALESTLRGVDLAHVGLDQDPALTERAEATTPPTWRRS